MVDREPENECQPMLSDGPPSSSYPNFLPVYRETAKWLLKVVVLSLPWRPL
jgi:hypothetical protein